jgi:HK97 family phage portal protein
MGFLSRAIERKASNSLELWNEILGLGRKSKSGPTINLENAIRVSALFGCLRVLSQGCAQVPFKLFREVQEGGLTKILAAREHPLYDKLASKPNDWQTSFEFREQMVIHAGLGNAYVWKNVVIGRKVTEMILLDPGRMEVKQPDEFRPPVYQYTMRSGKVLNFDASVIWHVRGPSWVGYAGMDILQMAREALGLAIATEATHAGLHANGVKSSGTYAVDGNLSPEQHAKITAWLKKEAQENAGGIMVVDRGAKWLSTAMTGVDSQHLETRKQQIEEVCRFMGVSPHKVYSSDKTSTYASAEQFNIQHVVDSLGPWYARIEQSADVNLLTDKERASGLYFKFIAAGLLRGAAKDRGEFYAKALGSGGSQGWMTPDEVRALEELNPLGGDAAKLPAPSSKQPEPAAAE